MSAADQYYALQEQYERVVTHVAGGELDDTPAMKAALMRMKARLCNGNRKAGSRPVGTLVPR